ncbi:MAG: DUF3426 domain-containing protein, partial [Gammaproteobacteria bacterium]|nr:DUF3426 domain-containing protein [Gammaproteobacteria bacterium]
PEPEPEPEPESGQEPVPEQISGDASAVRSPQDAEERKSLTEFDLFSLFDPTKSPGEQEPRGDDTPETDEEDYPPWRDIFALEHTSSSGDHEPTSPAADELLLDSGMDAAPDEDSADSDRYHDLFSNENVAAVQDCLTGTAEQTEASEAEYPPMGPVQECGGATSEDAKALSVDESKAEPSSTATGDEGDEIPDTPYAEAEAPLGTDGTSPSPDLDRQGGYRLPPQLGSHAGTPVGGTLLWGSGILLLLLALALQYLYYQRINLAESPMLRPLLSQMCELTGCRLPLRRDVDKIELIGHLMQAHPRYQNSLLITATVVNRAEFTQSFPPFEVIMTDLQQKIIARRQFHPEQYLIGEIGQWEFTPNTEIPLMLEVVDPGEEAVGFEFRFY